MPAKPPPLVFHRAFALVEHTPGARMLFGIESDRWIPAAPLPYVDVRAWAHYRGTFEQLPPLEVAWTIEVVSFLGAEVHELMDAALTALREDIDASRIEQGAHPGQPAERDPFSRDAETLTAWRRQQVERLTAPPRPRRLRFRRFRAAKAVAR